MNRIYTFGLLIALFFAVPTLAQVTNWEPSVAMDDQLFPSFILAHAGLPANEDETVQVDGKPYLIINEDGTAQVLVTLELSATSDVKLELLPSKINEYSVYEARLNKGSCAIYPKINYLYDVLRSQMQPTPLNLVFALTVNGKKVGQKTVTISLRSISECPYSQTFDETEVPEDLNYMFAAYVNEDDPQIDILLKEALKTGFVDQFTGYQGKNQDEISQNVINQVAAIWAAMANRGIQYSSITTTSNTNATVMAQRVRSFQDVMTNRQANCVDGSVFLCSALRAIDIKPFLVLIPGHCYMGFYLDENKELPYLLETTMIGYAKTGLKLGSPEATDKALAVFTQANDNATKKYNKAIKQFSDENNRDYELVDIDEVRKTIKPIGR